MKTLLITLLVFLSGCMTVRPISFNGETIYEVKCNGTARTYADCMTKASQTCAEQDKKAIMLDKDGNTLISSNGQGGFSTGIARSMLFKCED